MRVIEARMLREQQETGKKLCKEELYDSYSSPDIFHVFKSRRIR
jgi:hypothetical protein